MKKFIKSILKMKKVIIATANPEERKQLYKLFLKKRFRWNKILKGMYHEFRRESNHFDTMWIMKQKLITKSDVTIFIYLRLQNNKKKCRDCGCGLEDGYDAEQKKFRILFWVITKWIYWCHGCYRANFVNVTKIFAR